MTSTETISALERKLAAGCEGAQSGGRSVLGALRLAMARTASKLCDLPLAVIGAKQVRCVHEDVGGFLADDRMLVLLDGPDGQAGAVCLDTVFVTALIQQQTMGQVSKPTGQERAFTGTDAALAEPLIEAMLTRAANLAEQPADQRCLSGYRFGARVEDARSLLLLLEAEKFRIFDLTIDIAGGTAQGAACLVLPDLPEDPQEADAAGGKKRPKGPHLDQAFGNIRADLTAMVCRIRLPLSELSAMQPGDVIPLVRDRLKDTELLAIDGRCVAVGRLGQVNGLRALRLNESQSQARQQLPGGDDQFAAHVRRPEPDMSDAMIVDGTLAPHIADNTNHTGGGDPKALMGGVPAKTVPPGDDAENFPSNMSVEEAAAEISQLAGLTLNDAGEPEAEMADDALSG
jgi:flagellar motor switch protein FliM